MLEKRILIGVFYSFIFFVGFAAVGCSVKKDASTQVSKEVEEQVDESTISASETEKKEPMNKAEGSLINATLNCAGNSDIILLQLAAKKYDTQDFVCKVSREKGIKVQFTSESKKMEIIFKINGVETDMVKKGTYNCKSTNVNQFLDVSMNAKSLGQHNFGETFEGSIEIIDYGMSSDVICGKFAVIDSKGNKVEGNFNETISMF